MTEAEAIEKFRQKVLNQIEEEKDNFRVHEKDIKLIENTKDLLWRFLLYELELNDKLTNKLDLNQVNYDKASKLLLDTLKWRFEFGLHTFSDSDFPAEFYRMKMFTYALHEDKKRIFLFIRVCKYINISSEIRDFIIKGIIHEIEKKIVLFDPMYQHGVWDLKPIIVLDCTGIKYQSIDIQLLINMLTIVANHYPQVVDEFWMYGVPWFAKYLVPIVLKTIPVVLGKRIIQISYDDAVKRVGRNMLPKFMGGTSEIEPDLEVPQDASTLDELVKRFPIKTSDLEKYKKHLDTLKNSS